MKTMGRSAAHECDMLLQTWRVDALVPAPARRVENMLSMRYLGGENCLPPPPGRTYRRFGKG